MPATQLNDTRSSSGIPGRWTKPGRDGAEEVLPSQSDSSFERLAASPVWALIVAEADSAIAALERRILDTTQTTDAEATLLRHAREEARKVHPSVLLKVVRTRATSGR
jgi:hypothetical protein